MEPHIRELAETNFAATENKSPHPAVKIREKTVIEYVLHWHWPGAGGIFQRILSWTPGSSRNTPRPYRQTAAIGFVKITKEPQATIASDLIVTGASGTTRTFDHSVMAGRAPQGCPATGENSMKERPIIMSAESVRAIVDGPWFAKWADRAVDGYGFRRSVITLIMGTGL